MKYIRTHDGRIFNLIAYKEDGEINGGIKYTSKLNGSYFFIQKDNILKQADTIEELCDGFVVISEEYVEPHYVKGLIDTNALDFENHWRPYGNRKVLNKFCQELIDAVIYSAIWTSKVLIYVANMNEKGCLELL